MSSPENPLLDTGARNPPEWPVPIPTGRAENPPWSGWDVLLLAVFTLASVVVFLFVTAFAVQRIRYPGLTFIEVVKYPMVTVLAQLLAYVAVLGLMVYVGRRSSHRGFWQAVGWTWPPNWRAYLGAGVALSLGLQAFAHFLPMPKELPIDRFFTTPAQAWVLTIFGMTLAPLMEELFFRGFLYPVLARRWGVGASVLITAVCFGMIHAPQLGRAWGPVLIIFMVGIALTVARAVTKSVAPGFLMHLAYNGTISIALFVATGGFRHLERLNQ